MPRTINFDIFDRHDVLLARQYAREMAGELGFSLADQTRISTAVSEVTRQALQNEGKGSISLSVVVQGSRRGLECVCLNAASTQVPADPANTGIQTMFGGVERLVDDFSLEQRGGNEVAIVMRKWLPQEQAAACTR